MPITLGNTSITSSTGNLGIGTDSPTSRLNFVDSGVTFVSRDASGYARFTQANGSAQLGLFRSGSSAGAGGGYIGGDANNIFAAWKDTGSGFLPLMRVTQSGQLQSVIDNTTTVRNAYSCWAWVNFDGVAVSIRGSGNVSSVNRPETGHYTVNFSTAMPDTNYSVVCNRGDESNSGAATHRDMTMNPATVGRATGSVNLNSKQSQQTTNATNENCNNGFVAIFR